VVPVPLQLNGGETVNKDLFNVKDNVFVEKGFVVRRAKSPARHGFDYRNPGGR
jgi:hypothetical protein